MTTDVHPIALGDDTGRLLGAGRLATAISAACFLGLIIASAFLLMRSGIFPPPILDDTAPVIGQR